MSNLPYVAFYPGKWLGRTARLSALERGVFITLICEMYETMRPLKMEHKALARLCGTTPKTLEKALSVLLDDPNKLVMHDGGLWNHRVQKEIEKAQKTSEISRKNSQKRWEKRNKNNDDAMPPHCDGNAIQNQNHIAESSTELSLSETSSDPPPKKKRRNEYPPAFQAAWLAYPTDQNMSKAEAHQAWRRLDSADQDKLGEAIPHFAAYCRDNPDYRPIHMCRFIKKRRFDGFADGYRPRGHSPPNQPRTFGAIFNETMSDARQSQNPFGDNGDDERVSSGGERPRLVHSNG